MSSILLEWKDKTCKTNYELACSPGDSMFCYGIRSAEEFLSKHQILLNVEIQTNDIYSNVP